MIADNPKVEMIHVSQDFDEDSAEKWAADTSFPWLTVLPEDVERSDLMKYKSSQGVPFYTMVDSAGEVIATGSSAIFKKIGSLE